MLYGPRQSSKECKVLKGCSENHDAQRPFKDKEDRSSGNKKRAKTIRFYDVTQEVNTIKSHGEPIPKYKKEGNQKKNPKNYQVNADPSEDEHNYVIDCLNLGEPAHDSENKSERILLAT